MTSSLPPDPDEHRSEMLAVWLTVLLGTVSGVLMGIASFVLLQRRQGLSDSGRKAFTLRVSPDQPSLPDNKVKVQTTVALAAVPGSERIFRPGNLSQRGQQRLSWQVWTRPFVEINTRLCRFSLYRHYAWAILPFIIVTGLHVNSHMNFDTFKGYDMPQHFDNMSNIMQTGVMPRQTDFLWEAYQPPLFYVLTAWVAEVGQHFTVDGYMGWIPSTLFILSVLWTLIIIGFVQSMMRRGNPILKGLSVCVVMLMPVNVAVATMYNNDLPATLTIIISTLILWYMVRTGRYLQRKMWLRAAAVIGISMAFKSTALIMIAVYSLLAAYLGLLYLHRRGYRRMFQVATLAVIGLPLMLIPYGINLWHTIDSVGNPYGSIIAPVSVWDRYGFTFFTTFDISIFARPYQIENNDPGIGPGERSFWSVQYVTTHGDYLDVWNKPSYDTLADNMYADLHRKPRVPLTLFNTAILLEYVAIPITLIMIFGFAASLYQVIRRPYRALRDGSVVIVLLTVATEGAQFLRISMFANVRAVILHARFLSFMYMIVFIVGISWLWRLWAQRSRIVTIGLSLAMLAYTFVALQFLWLPPV